MLPTAGVLTRSAVDQPKWLHSVWACCRGKVVCADEPSCTVGFTPLSAWHTLMAKWLRLSARWWFSLASSPMPARDDALTFGPADLMAIKRTRGASGHRLLVIGAVWAERVKCEWLQLKCTTSLNQRVPALFSVTKNPFTINTVIRRTGQWIALPVRELKDVFSWKQRLSVSMCQKPVPHAWRTVVTFHMAIITCCLLFVAISGKRTHSGINRVLRLCAVRCK